MTESSVPMREGECRATRRGVMYCRIPRLGTRFCPTGSTSAGDCERRLHVTGDMRRGRWERRRIAAGLRARVPVEV